MLGGASASAAPSLDDTTKRAETTVEAILEAHRPDLGTGGVANPAAGV